MGDATRDDHASPETKLSSDATLISNRDETIVAPEVLPDPTEESSGFEGRYELGDLIGAGGMGEVRAIRDGWVGREVAMKTLREQLTTSPRARKSFLREVRIQGQLEHPSIVPVYDLGVTDDDEPYFTMRRVRGITLATLLAQLAAGDAAAQARFSRRKLLNAFSTMCLAIHYAHKRGVLHRDLKPANVMLGDFGEVYVLDWGIARVVQDAEDAVEVGEDSTAVGGRLAGTLAYMAPEQATGKEIDPRTDVYALGVILFEMLSLTKLLQESTPAKAVEKITEGVRAIPSEAAPNRDIPPELDAICMKATALHPRDRYESAKHLSEAVERFLDGDRDTMRRRELAEEAVRRAEAALKEASVEGSEPDAVMTAHLAAMREVLRALALDPESQRALSTFGTLLLRTPKEVPSRAAPERHAIEMEARAEGASLGYRGFLSYLLAFPLMVIAGIRSALLVTVGMILTMAAVLLSRHLRVKKDPSSKDFYTLLTVAASIVMLLGTWLGPFVLTPVAATLTSSIFALYAERHERRWVVVAAALMTAVPFVAELIPGVPSAFSFAHGEVVLHARALELPPAATTVGLVYTSVGFSLLPSLFLFRLRDALRKMEDRTFLQAWTLTQLFTPPPPSKPGPLSSS